ncbi:RNA polymerase sigma factor [Piscibacillus halophilus]|uniref:RNA polymerase sigma-70 factor, ECF subfamily n=1 Tax=Piscibacillus halophilus TaxID=571933 RepID=A0A1H9GS29_9BACI|nr:sigma-70 family RNA polymerase sigma factor [Piscibacillus halophilus]SEQ52833.1 RNA polymerase sigma-70 factor, ECF subfamily [Piscibacillus halophilus]
MENNFEALANPTNQLSEQERLEILEECMTQYGHEVKRVVYSYVKDSTDADDITQDVFVKVYENLNTFKGQSSFKSWVYSIAINKSKDHLRSLKKRQRIYKEKVVKLWDNKDDETPEKHSIRQEHSSQILKSVKQLPLKYREVIILYYFEDLTLKEIAEALSIKLNTAKARLQRARKKLKPKLEHDGGDQLG